MEKLNKKISQVSIDNYLPHNFLAEKIVLSSLLINCEIIPNITKKLTKESFYFKNHQELYLAIINMYNQNLSIDILTLITYLKDNGLLNKIGGIRVLIELINQVPNLVYFNEYVKLLQDKFVRRKLIKLGYKIINSGYITSISLEKLLQDLELELFSLTSKIKNQNILTTRELLSNILIKLKENSLNPGLSGLSSGFYDLDIATQGFQLSDLIIIAGRPSTGKTALCLNFAINIIKSTNLPIIFFSLEMSKEQLMYRLLSSEAEINSMRLRTGKLYKQDWVTLNNTIKQLSNLPFFIDDTPNLSIQDIRSKIKKIIFEQNNVGLVVIDYLQLMQNDKFKNNDRVHELSQITRALKNIAREFNIPIIALSQLNRNAENRSNKRPILSDLRESGSIEQDADLVLMLYKQTNLIKTSESQVTDLIIAKQRNGPIGTIQLKFNTVYTKFSSMTKIETNCPESDSN